MKHYNYRKYAALAAVLAAVLLPSCVLFKESTEEVHAPVIRQYVREAYHTEACARRDLEKTVSVYVRYVPAKRADLSFEVSGEKYRTFYVSAGDTVAEGALLMELDNSELEAALQSEREKKAAYASELSYLEERYALELEKQAVLDEIETDEEKAAAYAALEASYSEEKAALTAECELAGLRIAEYEEKLSKRRITAPFAGVVTYLYERQPEDRSEAGKKLVTVSDAAESLFYAESSYAAEFVPGELYTVTVGNGSVVCEARTAEEAGVFIADGIQSDGAVYLAVTEPGRVFEDDTRGKVELVVLHADQVLAVPASAISEINGETVVYFMDGDGAKRFKNVTVGMTDGRYVEIVKGLEEGDEVICD